MVKQSNVRVVHTMSKETKKKLDEIAVHCCMSPSAVINMLVVLFHKERNL